MHHTDTIIVGGGLVGSALALALADAGLRVALVEPHPPAAMDDKAWDARVYALSPGSRAWLETLGAWDRIPADRIGVIDAMRVHGDDPHARLGFDSYDGGLAALAYTVEHRTLQSALWACVEAYAGGEGAIDVRSGAAPHALELGTENGTEHAILTFDGEDPLRAALVVGADGLHSWTREAAGLAATVTPYGQQAIVANFATAQPHRGVALQWFRPDGVLALLPMPGDRVSAVWSIRDDEAARLLALEPMAFAQAVSEAAQGALGPLTSLTPPRALPLALVRVPRLVAPRVALAGDAAHGVHPLAGQGVNLGFRDAQTLAGVLAKREPGRDLGDLPLLRRYERARREDIWATQFVTDGLARLFSAEGAALARLRNAGLAAVDRLGPLKRFFTERAAA